LSRGERRPFFLGLGRRGHGCYGGWCVQVVGDARARLPGGPGAQGASGAAAGVGWATRGKVPGGPREEGKERGREKGRKAARVGVSAGPRGCEVGPGRGRGEREEGG
jgi:hypothetical protein